MCIFIYKVITPEHLIELKLQIWEKVVTDFWVICFSIPLQL